MPNWIVRGTVDCESVTDEFLTDLARSWEYKSIADVNSRELTIETEDSFESNIREFFELLDGEGFEVEFECECGETHSDLDELCETGCASCSTYDDDHGWYLTSDAVELYVPTNRRNNGYTVECRHPDTESYCCDGCNRDFVDGCVEEYGDNSVSLCGECWADDYFTCEDCGDCFTNDEYYGDGLCDSCGRQREEEEEDSSIIGEYGDEIDTTVFGSRRPDEITIGIELEVVSRGDRDDDAQEVLDNLPDEYVILKKDGSLPDGGFEIVTRPATLAKHKKAMKDFFANKPKTLVSHDEKKCGLHVHVGRDSLSESAVAKLHAFCNGKSNREFIIAVCGRESVDYAAIDPALPVLKKFGKHRRYNRYVILNLENKDTVEFRGHKGTLKESTFWMRVEFTHAVASYCNSKASIGSIDTPDGFIEWAMEERKTYPHLFAWLCERYPERKPRWLRLKEAKLPFLVVA